MTAAVRLVQFRSGEKGRRVGPVQGDSVADFTSRVPEVHSCYALFFRARAQGVNLSEYAWQLAQQDLHLVPYSQLLSGFIFLLVEAARVWEAQICEVMVGPVLRVKEAPSLGPCLALEMEMEVQVFYPLTLPSLFVGLLGGGGGHGSGRSSL